MENQIKNRFEELINEIDIIINEERNVLTSVTPENLQKINQWKQSVKYLLECEYGKESEFLKEFKRICTNNNRESNLIDTVKIMLKPILVSAMKNSNYSQRDETKIMNTNNIFIGHGRSHLWRELKDFIKDKLQLSYDEFNRVPVAGTTNIARLQQMLEQASFAFLIMTAEDELNDGKMQARMNVIHEVGLFQGRLGFEKAIILLEEGCEEFSNINGLGQIRFPKGNISAISEKIREVLERENII